MSSTLQNSITVAPLERKLEEVLADFENDLVRFESMSLKLYGHDQPLQFSRDMVLSSETSFSITRILHLSFDDKV